MFSCCCGVDWIRLFSFIFLGFCLEFREFLGSRSTSRNFQNIESDSFRNWSTLTNGDNITFFNSESWRRGQQHSCVFFVSVIFWNVMQVISSDNDGTVHFGGNNSTGQDFTSDGNSTSEWTFLSM